ncbi:MAG: hypothetical protein B7X41_00505 [Microbacterium sp. 14-71-5]|nr:MAG: hypothetical protein B7X32_09810 [Microbacterium sp. 13-71-7]OZB89870.1 MAG: hypothetical protein B7X41_00505 [Microbacterium sp. 14-71-5]
MGLAANETPGSIVTARAHTLSFGGADSNVAIALSRLGIPAIWISRLGIDPFGDLIERELRAEGVEVRATRDREHPTGFMLKQRRTTYTATVSYWRRNSAASFLSASDLPDDVLRDAAMLHVTGITPGLSESAQAATFDAIARARAAGVTVSFDVNHRDGVWSRETASPVYRRIAEAADIVFAGVEEAALLVAAPDGGLESAVSALGPDQVVIKRGADGATALIDGALLQQEAVPVEVVDTVGAGDAFVAGYLAAFLEGADPRGRLLQAVTTGALACTSRGDWEGSPNRADLLSQGATEGVAR